MNFKRRLFVPLFCFAFTASCLVSQQPGAKPAAMTNTDVVALATAGLGDEIVIAKINAAPVTAFDTSVDGLKALKAAGVSIEVVKTMIYPMSARAAVIAAAPEDPNDPKSAHSRGIYLMFDGPDGQSHMSRMGVVDPKQVTHSFFKFMAQLDGQHAPTQIVDGNPKFYAYAGEEVATFEAAVKKLVLVKLEVTSKGRQLAIGGLNAGVDESVKQEMTVVETRNGVLMMTPTKPLAPGEYALYEAGTWYRGAGTQNGGEYFDFGVGTKP